ncbi:general stress protein [Indiicoccus explosivorum]|uniref:general stress protein n=1 Tax=Indiicoccus explosivorum TaxID=1917864 RepID=UPI000B449A59
MKNHEVVGYYETEQEAIRAIEDLKDQGYHPEQISVISKDEGESEYVADETDTQAGEGAAAGALAGGAIGGIGGVLAGLGALAIPGVGPVLAAGPIAAGLTGAAAGAGVGGLAGALIGMGVPEEEAHEYESHFNEGKILVLVEEGDGIPVRDEADTRGITIERRETFDRDNRNPAEPLDDSRNAGVVYREGDDLPGQETYTGPSDNRTPGNGANARDRDSELGDRNFIASDMVGGDQRHPVTGEDLAPDRTDDERTVGFGRDPLTESHPDRNAETDRNDGGDSIRRADHAPADRAFLKPGPGLKDDRMEHESDGVFRERNILGNDTIGDDDRRTRAARDLGRGRIDDGHNIELDPDREDRKDRKS